MSEAGITKAWREQCQDAERDVRELKAENEKLRAALKEIAGQDYRGNRPRECVIAFYALKDLDAQKTPPVAGKE